VRLDPRGVGGRGREGGSWDRAEAAERDGLGASPNPRSLRAEKRAGAPGAPGAPGVDCDRSRVVPAAWPVASRGSAIRSAHAEVGWFKDVVHFIYLSGGQRVRR
jgi:hypothetical protein